MNMNEVKAMASDLGIKAGRMKKAELIHAIQAHEGTYECYATDRVEQCGEESCLWRADCQKDAIKE